MRKKGNKVDEEKRRIRTRKRALARWRGEREANGYNDDGVGSLGARLRELGYANYESYLASKHWNVVRERFKPPGSVCAAECGMEAKFLHHLDYRNLGDEGSGDVVPLCAQCHERVHQSEFMGARGGLRRAFERIRKRNRTVERLKNRKFRQNGRDNCENTSYRSS
jgi:hypothetical protein